MKKTRYESVETPRLREIPSTKKIYTEPQLQVYGDLRSITAHVNNTHPHGDPPPHDSGNFRT
jgi:hypothetical protein